MRLVVGTGGHKGHSAGHRRRVHSGGSRRSGYSQRSLGMIWLHLNACDCNFRVSTCTIFASDDGAQGHTKGAKGHNTVEFTVIRVLKSFTRRRMCHVMILHIAVETLRTL